VIGFFVSSIRAPHSQDQFIEKFSNMDASHLGYMHSNDFLKAYAQAKGYNYDEEELHAIMQ